ncbi:MAG: hypothetical protein ACUVTZ_11015 [Armatimonadota bacterium]
MSQTEAVMVVSAERRTSVIGWHGITVEVPKEWSFAAYSGDSRAGYFRVDGPTDTALEVKWTEEKGIPRLRKVLKDFEKRLVRSARKSGVTPTLREKPKPLAPLRIHDRVPITFGWEAQQAGYGALWHCKKCHRIVLAQVVGRDRTHLGQMALRILSTLQDHPQGSHATWSVYDLTFSAPSDMLMEKHQLRSGYISMELKRKGASLVIERWGLANIVLKRDTPSGWLSGALFPRLKAYQYTKFEGGDLHGHSLTVFRGRRFGIRALLARAGSAALFRQSCDWLYGCGWHCPESNRIYAVLTTASRDAAEQLAKEVAESTICH